MSWERLRSQIALSEGFWLGFLFGLYRGEIEELEHQAAEVLQAEGKDLDVRDLSEPEDLDVTLGWLLRERPATTGLVWLVGTGGLSDVRGWLTWWEQLLRRLNEQREALRHAVPCGLVLAGPSGLLRVARDAAPDLWSYRSMLLEAPYRALNEAIILYEFPIASDNLAVGRSARVTIVDRYGESPDSLLRLWAALDRLGGARAERGDLQNGLAAYTEALALGRRILREGGESPKLLGNLTQSLRSVGQVHQSLGDLDAALSAYVEAIGLARRIVERFGETPDALRTLADLLSAAAEVQEAQGDLDAARARRREAQEIVDRTGS